MRAEELKKKYLDYFKKKGHAVIPSSSLIPENDSSVLFNTAGMQPLVPFLLGQNHPRGKRLVNLQKCLRTVDFDNIGDNVHHTFFQMLGNWSLGDYFKKESIAWSFEFLTSKKWLNLPLSKLAFSVYIGDESVHKDDESAKLWLSLGAKKERVAYLGKDNFWSAGETGPCGPSTEIFYWTGDKPAPKIFDPADNLWVEIWNNVFMTYNRKEDGALELLKQKNVDTGMGFERILAVLNGKKSAYETELFLPLIKEIEKLSKKKYSFSKGGLGFKEMPPCWANDMRQMRIIVDHLRAAVFLIGDQNGIVPSNVDQGYILRRLIRRAVRLGRLIGIGGCFTVQIAEITVENYKLFYPELLQNRAKILSELENEEHKFNSTLEHGLKEFEKTASRNKEISGKEAFLLFQSYGFPIEMTQELATEKKIKVDVKAFHQEYQRHQELSRVGAEKKFKGGLADTSEETAMLHTATHLLNEALRKILKYDIKQRGSNITSERLRFDFNFARQLTKEELKKVEDEVNRVIKLKLKVARTEMKREEALKVARGEFGAKYPEKVLVYSVGDYSKEICMGPHVRNTSQLGIFRIKKEESSSAGIRRIKAVLE